MTPTPYRDVTGDDPDGRYTFVEVHTTDTGTDDEPAPPPRRPKRRPKRTGRRRSRDHSAEYAIGAMICMAATGYLAYRLTHDVMGQPRDVCLVVAGLAAGLSTWTPRTFEALRRGLARTIAPKGGR